VTAAAWAAAGTLAATAGSVLLGAAVGLPGAVHVAVATAGLAAIAAAAAAGWVRRPADLYLARLIEQHRPDLKNALVTFVELGAEPGTDPSVRAALGRRAARLLARDPAEMYLPAARWRRPAWAVGAAAVTLGGVLWLAQGTAVPAWLPQARAGMEKNHFGLRPATCGAHQGDAASAPTPPGQTPTAPPGAPRGRDAQPTANHGPTASASRTPSSPTHAGGEGATTAQASANRSGDGGGPRLSDAGSNAETATADWRGTVNGHPRTPSPQAPGAPFSRDAQPNGGTGHPTGNRRGREGAEGPGEPGAPHADAALAEALAADAARFNRLAQALGEAPLGPTKGSDDTGTNTGPAATAAGTPLDPNAEQGTGSPAEGGTARGGAASPKPGTEAAGPGGGGRSPRAPRAGDPPLGRYPLTTDAPENVLDTMRRAKRMIEKADRADRDGRVTDAFLGRMGLSRSEFRRFVVAWQERFRAAEAGPSVTLPPRKVRTLPGETAGETIRAPGSAEARPVVVPAHAGEPGRLVQEAASRVSPRLRPAVQAYFEAVGRLFPGRDGGGTKAEP